MHFGCPRARAKSGSCRTGRLSFLSVSFGSSRGLLECKVASHSGGEGERDVRGISPFSRACAIRSRGGRKLLVVQEEYGRDIVCRKREGGIFLTLVFA